MMTVWSSGTVFPVSAGRRKYIPLLSPKLGYVEVKPRIDCTVCEAAGGEVMQAGWKKEAAGA